MDELKEAKRQIDSTLHKLAEVVRTFEQKENPKRYQSQLLWPNAASMLLLLRMN